MDFGNEYRMRFCFLYVAGVKTLEAMNPATGKFHLPCSGLQPGATDAAVASG